MMKPHFIGHGSYRSAINWTSMYVEVENDVLVIFDCNVDTYKFFAGTTEGNSLLDKYYKYIVVLSSTHEASCSGIPMLLKYFETRPRGSIAAYEEEQKLMKIITPNKDRLAEYIGMFNRDFEGQVKTYEPERIFYEIMQTYEMNSVEYIPQFTGFGLWVGEDEKLGMKIEYYIVPFPSILITDEQVDLSYASYMLSYSENGERKNSIFYNGVSGYAENAVPLDKLFEGNGTYILTARGIEKKDPDKLMENINKIYEKKKDIPNIILTGFNSLIDKQNYDNSLNKMLNIVGAE